MAVFTPEDSSKLGVACLEKAVENLKKAAEYLAYGIHPTAEQAITLGASTGKLEHLIREVKGHIG